MDSKSHADFSKMRRTNDNQRRNSFGGEENPLPMPNANESDRRRAHWATVMNRTSTEHPSRPENNNMESLSTTEFDSARMSTIFERHHDSNVAATARSRVSSQNPIDIGQSSRSVRKQPLKPFQCTQCHHRFERRGHLKVSSCQF